MSIEANANSVKQTGTGSTGISLKKFGQVTPGTRASTQNRATNKPMAFFSPAMSSKLSQNPITDELKAQGYKSSTRDQKAETIRTALNNWSKEDKDGNYIISDQLVNESTKRIKEDLGLPQTARVDIEPYSDMSGLSKATDKNGDQLVKLLINGNKYHLAYSANNQFRNLRNIDGSQLSAKEFKDLV